MKTDALVIKDVDNVATAIRDIQPGEEATVGMEEKTMRVRALETIPFGHKIAVSPIAKGEDIIKYGEIIGRATDEISPGGHAHIQNIESLRGRGDLASEGQKDQTFSEA